MGNLSLNDFKTQVSYGNEDLNRVLVTICAKGSMFPSEIARKCELSIEQVNSIITKLLNSNLIEKIIPDRVYPQKLIACRIAEMWSLGVEGFPVFATRSWYALTLDGILKIKVEYSGQHKEINAAYLEEYDLILNA